MEGSNLVGSTDIADQEVDCVIREYKDSHPNDGEEMIIGHIRSLNMLIPRSRIRECLHRLDPEGIEYRKRTTIRRRVYHVLMGRTVFDISMAIINLLDTR